MNIKNIHTAAILPVDSKQRVDGHSRTQASADRDGNGKREQNEPEIKRSLSDQEFDDALKALAELPGLKSNNLTIKVEQGPDARVILILDGVGNIVRRLSEGQLWLATRDREKQTGRILDKAM